MAANTLDLPAAPAWAPTAADAPSGPAAKTTAVPSPATPPPQRAANRLHPYFPILILGTITLLALFLAIVGVKLPTVYAHLVTRQLLGGICAGGLAGCALLLWQTAKAQRATQVLADLLGARLEQGDFSSLGTQSRSVPAALQWHAEKIFAILAQNQRGYLNLLATNRAMAWEYQALSNLLDTLNVGLVAISSGGDVLAVNRLAAPFAGLPAAECRGKLAQACITQPKLRDLITNTVNKSGGPGLRTIELTNEESNGQGHLSVTQCCLLDADGNVEGQMILTRDVTILKNMERAQIEFVDHVAHEFRTPLTSILAYTETLIHGQNSPDASAKFYNVIYEEAYRLSNLIDNLLNISQLESGLATINISPVRLKKLLENVVEIVEPQCEKKNIKLVAELPDRLPTLNIDKNLFAVAVLNILGNAVKYTPNSGTVTLWTTSRETEFHISIRDTGIGIAEEDCEKIFEKFFRCANASSSEANGSGVGLATAIKIIRVHGGDIRLSSKLGEGSQFTIALPRGIINTAIGE